MRDTMRLDGGIDMYTMNMDRYGDGPPCHGRKVTFLNTNGWDGEAERANQYFEEGQVLTIKEIWISRSSSEVEFEELPGKRFNTVMFADVAEQTI